ncbi:hypothetical protein HDU67_002242 [Dinochytrium kinnereticum]|nr:hypothetical protein HDU67_002242 [Dinochytrium kinnereticum]
MKKLLRRISSVGLSPRPAVSPFNLTIEQLVARDKEASSPNSNEEQRKDKASSSNGDMDASSSSSSNKENIPIILQQFVRFLSSSVALETEGLFRTAGSVKLIREMREEIDRTQTLDFASIEPFNIPSAAAVFKQWLRDIPDGLIPKKYFQPMLDAGSSPQKIKEVLLSMPRANYCSLDYLLKYLMTVASKSQVNRMSVQNLVIVFAPNIFRCPSAPSGPSKGSPEKYLVESMQITKSMVVIMDHYHDLFEEGLRRSSSDYFDEDDYGDSRKDFSNKMQSRKSTSDAGRKAEGEESADVGAYRRKFSSEAVLGIHSRKSTEASWAGHSTDRSSGDSSLMASPTLSQRKLLNATVSETVQSMLFLDAQRKENHNVTKDASEEVIRPSTVVKSRGRSMSLALTPSSYADIRGAQQSMLDELKAFVSPESISPPTHTTLPRSNTPKTDTPKSCQLSKSVFIPLKPPAPATAAALPAAKDQIILKSVTKDRPKPPGRRPSVNAPNPTLQKPPSNSERSSPASTSTPNPPSLDRKQISKSAAELSGPTSEPLSPLQETLRASPPIERPAASHPDPDSMLSGKKKRWSTSAMVESKWSMEMSPKFGATESAKRIISNSLDAISRKKSPGGIEMIPGRVSPPGNRKRLLDEKKNSGEGEPKPGRGVQNILKAFRPSPIVTSKEVLERGTKSFLHQEPKPDKFDGLRGLHSSKREISSPMELKASPSKTSLDDTDRPQFHPPPPPRFNPLEASPTTTRRDNLFDATDKISTLSPTRPSAPNTPNTTNYQALSPITPLGLLESPGTPGTPSLRRLLFSRENAGKAGDEDGGEDIAIVQRFRSEEIGKER